MLESGQNDGKKPVPTSLKGIKDCIRVCSWCFPFAAAIDRPGRLAGADTFLCKENRVTISQDTTRGYRFQSSGRIQVEGLSGGSMTRNKGVPVYKFKDGDKQYWLWDGSKNNPPFGSLEVYEKDALVLQLECARQPPQ
jgi:hypothetical protein